MKDVIIKLGKSVPLSIDADVYENEDVIKTFVDEIIELYVKEYDKALYMITGTLPILLEHRDKTVVYSIDHWLSGLFEVWYRQIKVASFSIGIEHSKNKTASYFVKDIKTLYTNEELGQLN